VREGQERVIHICMPHADMISSASMFATRATIPTFDYHQDYSKKKKRKTVGLAPLFYRPSGLHPQLFTRNLFCETCTYEYMTGLNYDENASANEKEKLLHFAGELMNGRNPWDFQKMFIVVNNHSLHYVLALIQINTKPSSTSTLQLTASVEVHDSGLDMGDPFSSERKLVNRKIVKTITKYLHWASSSLPLSKNTKFVVEATEPVLDVPQQNTGLLSLECGVFSMLSVMK
jgi:hypothetical protein